MIKVGKGKRNSSFGTQVVKCSVKKVFLKISQISKVFSCSFCKIFMNTYFKENLRMAASFIKEAAIYRCSTK